MFIINSSNNLEKFNLFKKKIQKRKINIIKKLIKIKKKQTINKSIINYSIKENKDKILVLYINIKFKKLKTSKKKFFFKKKKLNWFKIFNYNNVKTKLINQLKILLFLFEKNKTLDLSINCIKENYFFFLKILSRKNTVNNKDKISYIRIIKNNGFIKNGKKKKYFCKLQNNLKLKTEKNKKQNKTVNFFKLLQLFFFFKNKVKYYKKFKFIKMRILKKFQFSFIKKKVNSNKRFSKYLILFLKFVNFDFYYFKKIEFNTNKLIFDKLKQNYYLKKHTLKKLKYYNKNLSNTLFAENKDNKNKSFFSKSKKKL